MWYLSSESIGVWGIEHVQAQAIQLIYVGSRLKGRQQVFRQWPKLVLQPALQRLKLAFDTTDYAG
ncbi:hypothetical protein [Gloeobacter morelensis]|uniref:Uncharacterized protein n=1 Tax=Gloeobacter morelensis MG652769 TaxID=2781736 RepID=A0ABY3PRV6_9CYAN|nr:hypothetical protein [Gloeobacter morelensis]UFP96463.1 hypothetical protein ISF26_09725 [Gloeobacter morelensis MG652769]